MERETWLPWRLLLWGFRDSKCQTGFQQDANDFGEAYPLGHRKLVEARSERLGKAHSNKG